MISASIGPVQYPDRKTRSTYLTFRLFLLKLIVLISLLLDSHLIQTLTSKTSWRQQNARDSLQRSQSVNQVDNEPTMSRVSLRLGTLMWLPCGRETVSG